MARSVVGGFLLTMGGVHRGVVAADPPVYRHCADDDWFGCVSDGWQHIVMARPELDGLLLMAGGLLLGTALLVGGRAAQAGWLGVIAFHFVLLPFGWWAWVWAVHPRSPCSWRWRCLTWRHYNLALLAAAASTPRICDAEEPARRLMAPAMARHRCGRRGVRFRA